MTSLIVLSVLAVAGVVATVRSAFHDAPRARPRSHRPDPDFLAPAARSLYDRIA